MTDVGLVVGPGPAAAGDEPTFRALTAFVTRFTELMRRVLSDLTRVPGLGADFEAAIRIVIRERTIDEYAGSIIRSVTELDEDARASLVIHGLTDESADMRLKMAAFDAAVRASRYVETASGEFRHPSEAGQTESQVVEALSSVGSALIVANSVLKSASHAIPLAGAYGELKDSAESGINLLKTAVGWGRKLARRFRKARRPEPEPASAE